MLPKRELRQKKHKEYLMRLLLPKNQKLKFVNSKRLLNVKKLKQKRLRESQLKNASKLKKPKMNDSDLSKKPS